MSPRTKEAFGRMREERINGIVAAAYQVFSLKGYRGTMIEDIAQAADISKGLLYHYFDSKEALFTTLFSRVMRGALRLIQAAAARPGSPWERLSWLVEEITSRAGQEPAEFMVIMQALTTDTVPEEVRAMAAEFTMSSSKALRGLIVEGQGAGEIIQGDPDRLAMTLTACLQGLILNTIIPLYQVSDLLDGQIVLRMLKA
jgi:AcrR family transcriptional regulator